MKKIHLADKIKCLKNVIMKNKKNTPKLDASKLRQVPDEVNISSKIYKYHPDVEAYEKVVQEGSEDILEALRNKFKS